MRLESVLFAAKRPYEYERLAAVLALSAAENSPGVPLTIHRIDERDDDLRKLFEHRQRRCNYLENARKAKHHLRLIEEADDGELLCLIDCDTLILDDLSPAERFDFDLAYTVRPGRWPINSGVYFVRASAAMRKFARCWAAVCFEMLANEPLHNQWKTKYGGIHQSALGYLLEHEDEYPRIKTHQLACDVWNSVPQTWWMFGPSTRVVHVMSSLREMCMGRVSLNKLCRPLVKRWKEFDERAREQCQQLEQAKGRRLSGGISSN